MTDKSPGRPRKYSEPVSFAITVEKTDNDRIEQEAARKHKSKNDVVYDALKAYIGGDPSVSTPAAIPA